MPISACLLSFASHRSLTHHAHQAPHPPLRPPSLHGHRSVARLVQDLNIGRRAKQTMRPLEHAVGVKSLLTLTNLPRNLRPPSRQLRLHKTRSAFLPLERLRRYQPGPAPDATRDGRRRRLGRCGGLKRPSPMHHIRTATITAALLISGGTALPHQVR